MRDALAFQRTLLVALVMSPVVASAQRTIDDAEPAASPTITTKPQAENQAQARRGVSEFRALHNPVISPDGAWLAAEERSEQGDGKVRVWSTVSNLAFTIERGQNPRISRDSRWVSALQKPLLEDSNTAKPTKRREGQTLVLLDTQDGSRRTFDFVLSYDMTYASTYLLYLQSPETRADEDWSSKDEAANPATEERKLATLHQIPLNPDRLAKILQPYQPGRKSTTENVVEFATHPTSDHFAYVLHDKATGGDTLRVVKWGIRAWFNGERIEGLCWGRDPHNDRSATPPSDHIILGFVVSTEPTDKNGNRGKNSALYTWRPAQSSAEQFTRMNSP